MLWSTSPGLEWKHSDSNILKNGDCTVVIIHKTISYLFIYPISAHLPQRGAHLANKLEGSVINSNVLAEEQTGFRNRYSRTDHGFV